MRGGCGGRGRMAGAAGDERGSHGGDGEGEPAGAVHALVGEEGCSDGEDYRHGAHHQRGVGDGGEGEAGELDEELEGYSHERGEQKQAPVGAAEAGAMEQKQGRKRERGKQEAVEHHGANVHLDEGELAEKKSASPERAGEGAGRKAESAGFGRIRHGRSCGPPVNLIVNLPCN